MADLTYATSAFPYEQYPEVEPLTKVLCDTGDVLLVADDCSHPPLRIQVSSFLLSTASKVFRALFRGTFAEGRAVLDAAGSSIEILVRDDPSDLLLLCQLLHFQGDLTKVRHERFLGLALIIDKYDCATALQHTITSKFAMLELSGVYQEEHVYYLTAAWVLDQPKFFRDLSKEIVMRYEHSPTGLTDSRLDVLPDKVLTSIHAQRVFAGQDLTYHLSKFITKYHAAAFELKATAYSNELDEMLLGLDLWPLDLRVHSLAYVFGQLREYHVPVMQADILPEQKTSTLMDHLERSDAYIIDHPRRYFDNPPRNSTAKVVKPPTKFELVHIVERIELFCVGLCLDCLKGKGKCRVKHTDPFDKDLWIPLRHMRSNGGSDYGEDTKRPVDWEIIW